MTASRILRRARLRAGLSQRALAAAAGLPQSTVGRIESGTLSPRVDTLVRLLAAAGHGLEVDAALGRGIDRSQIRELLRLMPAERARLAAADAAALLALEHARRA